MKGECGFYPFPVGLAQDRVWGSDMLGKLKSPSGRAWFVPLGRLESGLYRLQLEGLNDNAGTCIEIINDEFDYVDMQNVNREANKMSLQFQSDVRSEYFLRITTRKPAGLDRVEIITEEQ